MGFIAYKAHVSRHDGFMIGTAYQQGTHVRVISPEGQTLFTQKGKLLGYTAEFVSIHKRNAIHICNNQGRTISTHRFVEEKQVEASSSKSVLFYLIFGCLTKMGDAYRLYQFLGRGNAIGFDGGDLNWKNIGIWVLSMLFWLACFLSILWL